MSTRPRPYPAYRHSGVEWLGRIPAHWEAKRLKFVAATPLAYGANESAETNDANLPRFIRITDIKSDGSLHDDTFRSLPEEVARPFLLKDGDLLLARSGATVGKTFMYRPSWGRACHAGYLIRCRVNRAAAIPEFVSYFATSAQYWGWLSSVFIQATIQNVSAEKYANLWLPTPPLPEQTAITEFLDRHTGEIDALVKKKERLIELLQEKRTALISHAVTKGLNPNAPMKDSRILWLGQIPVHWQSRRLKFRLKKIEQGWSPQCENRPAEPGEWGVLKVGCMNSSRYEESENKALPADVEPAREFEIRIGDVLMSRANTAELVGSVGIVHKTQGRILLCDKLFLLIFNTHLLPEYATYLLRSPIARRQIEQAASGASPSMKNISNSAVTDLVLPFPPVDEQRRIVQWISTEPVKLDALVAKIRTAVERLQEYRTALVSAAVTGQIDVGNHATAVGN
jgi:type I restriction enzyme S subunit